MAPRWSALQPTAPGESLAAHLAGLEAARLVFLAQNGSEARYAFRQTVVREVSYGSLSAERRRELHARLAAHLEAQHADDPDAHAELLAHHHEAAHAFLPAARYLVRAGRKARQRYAYAQAAACYDRALAALARLPAEAGEDAEVHRCRPRPTKAGATWRC